MKRAGDQVYSLEFTRSAQREFDSIPVPKWREEVRAVIRSGFVGVSAPPQGEPVADMPNHFSIDIGDHHYIFYQVCEQSRMIILLGVLPERSNTVH
jgi:plasmid stabilization system protein ParE